MEIEFPAPEGRGVGKDWVFIDSFQSEEECAAHLLELKVIKGRVNTNISCRRSYYTCAQSGCKKQFRVVRHYEEIGDGDEFYIEEDLSEEHDHEAADVVLRGMTAAQKAVVLSCHARRQSTPKQIVEEFGRLAKIEIAANQPVVPTPSMRMIGSFTAYRRKMSRKGVAVGSTSLEDLEAYSLSKKFGKLLSHLQWKIRLGYEASLICILKQS